MDCLVGLELITSQIIQFHNFIHQLLVYYLISKTLHELVSLE